LELWRVGLFRSSYDLHFPQKSHTLNTILLARLLSTDHELIPARNTSLAVMHGSASGSNVRYYSTWKHTPFKERKGQGRYNT
jgi:hypothetical protein